MPRAAGIAIENSFRAGHITEASGLNFPENACTDAENCVFNYDGSVQRRLGFDFEDGYSTKTIDRTNSVVQTYLWKNVAGDGDTTILVVQVGATLYFYETGGVTISSGAIADTVSLTAVSGAPTTELIEAQFATGNGLLFVTHPYIEPMRITYDTGTQNATATNITLQIRDFEGDTADTETVDSRPTSTFAGLDVNHKYNLYNQGWNTANLSTATNNWDATYTTMPSNADVMWSFKNSSDVFDATTAPNVINGNSPAPKGHFILTLATGDRDAASGFSGCTASSAGSRRPTTCAFFAGRVFYAGIPTLGFNSKIYFTQIIERAEQYGMCYQKNDPTAEEAFELLPDDGGVISIPEAGTIYKLFAIAGGLAVFAQNGTWIISGSTGLGFTANDYTVQKISSVNAISASSFVDIMGYPAWWNSEGIYILTSDGNAPTIKNITDAKIKSLYDAVPQSSKLRARGAYNPILNVVQWLYHEHEVGAPEDNIEYERILNYNLLTEAFYVWSIPDHTVTLNSVTILDGSIGALTLSTVINDVADTVIDGSSNIVIAYEQSNQSAVPSFIYLVSYADGASYKFTFAAARSAEYLDWFTYDVTGTEYDSYFITGYKLHADAMKKFQANYLTIYSRNDADTAYYIQGIWDYANTGSGTGRWSTPQLVEHADALYDNMIARRKIRGHGKVLQFKVYNSSTTPFDILGWAGFETANSLP